MRITSIIASSACSIVVVLAQGFDISAALAVSIPTANLGPALTEVIPATVTYDQAAATALQSLEGKAGPVPGIRGTVNDYYYSESALRRSARDAGTPPGYEKVFTDLIAANEQIGYLGFKINPRGEYDVSWCADWCDSESFCLGFNIYFQRDPEMDPRCDWSGVVTNVKCVIYGYPVAEGSATNKGQFFGDFAVVITGSNGYSKVEEAACKTRRPSIGGFGIPQYLVGAISAPVQRNGTNTATGLESYNGMKLFNQNPYDPFLCAAACQAQTEFHKTHLGNANGKYRPCNYFNSFILTKNAIPLGTYCSLYAESRPVTDATNFGVIHEKDRYDVLCSAGYTATPINSGNSHGNNSSLVH
ncbi:hypothetical protein LEMA_P058690.1 [Plenodomus lingam JN3]|uniref:Uncharacterized protein n=1 Tax=Leptosphaeria maculans (strain JN3 / isolate v23.1.3 / race Av1-4-5-6-7-8) TaxID=985895 RepID=E4ZHK2_LEPMJ|nr:hypothetical protein LEMA_P058690.1 [Plenodomus lingam JN3]CBX90835.1 hypothetical protein LEMA_P058690.1 [Plenodomus lingam JN3]